MLWRPSSLSLSTISKHEYLRGQQTDHNQIISEASLGGGGKAVWGFGADQFRTLVSMATDSSHRVIMGKTFSRMFLIGSFSYLQVTMTCMRAWMSLTYLSMHFLVTNIDFYLSMHFLVTDIVFTCLYIFLVTNIDFYLSMHFLVTSIDFYLSMHFLLINIVVFLPVNAFSSDKY